MLRELKIISCLVLTCTLLNNKALPAHSPNPGSLGQRVTLNSYKSKSAKHGPQKVVLTHSDQGKVQLRSKQITGQLKWLATPTENGTLLTKHRVFQSQKLARRSILAAQIQKEEECTSYPEECVELSRYPTNFSFDQSSLESVINLIATEMIRTYQNFEFDGQKYIRVQKAFQDFEDLNTISIRRLLIQVSAFIKMLQANGYNINFLSGREVVIDRNFKLIIASFLGQPEQPKVCRDGLGKITIEKLHKQYPDTTAWKSLHFWTTDIDSVDRTVIENFRLVIGIDGQGFATGEFYLTIDHYNKFFKFFETR